MENYKYKLFIFIVFATLPFCCKKKVGPDRCFGKNKEVIIKIINQTDDNLWVLTSVRHCDVELDAYYENYQELNGGEITEYSRNGEHLDFTLSVDNGYQKIETAIKEDFQFITILITHDGTDYYVEFIE